MEKNSSEGLISLFPELNTPWVWNGYYTRQLNSPSLNFFGKVAIRVAYNKEKRAHHAFIPSFIIPHLKLTSFDLQLLISTFIESVSVSLCLEKYSEKLPEYFDLAPSSFYFLLMWVCKKFRSVLNLPISGNSLNHFLPYLNQHNFLNLLKNLNARSPPF